MQGPKIAQMGSLHVFFFFFFFSIFQQHSLPQCIVTICVKKKAHRNCGLFSKGSGAGNGNAIRSAQIACRARSSCFLPYLVCKIYHTK